MNFFFTASLALSFLCFCATPGTVNATNQIQTTKSESEFFGWSPNAALEMDFDNTAYKTWVFSDPTGAYELGSPAVLEKNPWATNKHEVCTAENIADSWPNLFLVAKPNVYGSWCEAMDETDSNVFLSGSLASTTTFNNFVQSSSITSFGTTLEVADPDGVLKDNYFMVRITIEQAGVETLSANAFFKVGQTHFVGFYDATSTITSVSFTATDQFLVCFDDIYIEY